MLSTVQILSSIDQKETDFKIVTDITDDIL